MAGIRTPYHPVEITPGKKPKKIKNNTARLYDMEQLGPYFNGVGGRLLTKREQTIRKEDFGVAQSKRNLDAWYSSNEYKNNVGKYSKNTR